MNVNLKVKRFEMPFTRERRNQSVMKCLDCGAEMEKGTVEGVGQGGGHWYEFTSDKEKKKKGLKGFFTRKTISVKSGVMENPAWHCPECRKVLMWMDSGE